MKIFALNLCLHLTWKHALKNPQRTLISYVDLMNDLFKGNIPDSRTFYLEVSRDASTLKEIIELQKNEVWRNLDLTICLVFSGESAYEGFIQDFRDYFSNVDTAGGLVENEKGEYLMILHRKRWSLPKGQVEWREDPEEAAIREVKEETGLKEVELLEKMEKTYHTFRKGRKWIFKTTNWYKMRASSVEQLVPQMEEHITDIRWVNAETWPEIEPNAFPQIRYLLSGAF
ncbi:MAG: NUDIX domain-containing protein [Bacteroidota bacterium]